MENYYWQTSEPLANNSVTMNEFLDDHLDYHCGEGTEIILEDGTYSEIKTPDGKNWGVHASGNGDFCNHLIRFELLTPESQKE
tara:strand:+ start:234 stop:482 length:249 start_codon:yes stop_codon:yes gene_type:complete